MDRAQLTRVLANVAAFKGVGEATLVALADEMRPVTFDAGQSIFARGDPGSELYVVLAGRVRLSVLTIEGRELSFTHAVEGDLFGEIAMLDGGSRTADATAATAVRAAVLGLPALRRLIASDADLTIALMRCLCGRIRMADMQLEGVALHRIEVRLARYLIGLARQKAPDAVEGNVEVDLAMSQGELALLLGASRPKVNGALVALEDQGAINRRENRIACDLAVLGEVAELG